MSTASKHAGFTLIELGAVLVIAAILVAIAVPSFWDMIQNNRLVSKSTQLVSSLNYARSEAVRRAQTVSLCASSNGTACTNSAWEAGWIVFTDTGAAGVVDGGDEVLRVEQGVDNGVTLNLNNANYIQYQPQGFVQIGYETNQADLLDIAFLIQTTESSHKNWQGTLLGLLPISDAYAGSGKSGKAKGIENACENGGKSGKAKSGKSGKAKSGKAKSGKAKSGKSGKAKSGKAKSGKALGNGGCEELGGGTGTASGGGVAAINSGTFSLCDKKRSGETGHNIGISSTGRVSVQTVTCQ